ncbi:hypothetical protein [Beggiatoa leptomitoformis]|uniref:Acyl carrier protein n=1 Tax=Beggiatoa leptomitoformis TaxID=288004 RepID=A0A2N9YIL3_9GAMM|nr:hypothetical protein [Beggiatoa leptomitoformis]ALG67415.1 hypothetical protein AL038_06495 [Beggiatoa leptomitoformis]AUI70372.1 hypothetical protein BLE401_17810 [Beggiatoa leptomitoformis]
MSLTADDVLETINTLLHSEGLSVTSNQLHLQIVGDLFEEHDNGDEFVGQVLQQYQIRTQGWIDIDTVQELIDFIVNQKKA